MNTHLVIKRLPGPNGQPIEAGSEVDASEWRNAPLLVEQRYLKPLDGVEAPVNSAPLDLSDFRGRVTEIVLQDLRENGPIAHALKTIEPGSIPAATETKLRSQERAKK